MSLTKESGTSKKEKNTMKKYLIIAFAICVLFLSACSSRVEPSTSASPSTAYPTGSITTTSTQNSCQGLHDQQTQFSQQYHIANIQFSAAQDHGDPQQVGDAVKRLTSLRQSITQVQAQLRLCYKNVD